MRRDGRALQFGEYCLAWSLDKPGMVIFNVTQEVRRVTRPCGRGKNYGFNSFIQYRSESVDYGFVKVIDSFGVVSKTDELERLFWFGNVAVHTPQGSFIFLEANERSY